MKNTLRHLVAKQRGGFSVRWRTDFVQQSKRTERLFLEVGVGIPTSVITILLCEKKQFSLSWIKEIITTELVEDITKWPGHNKFQQLNRFKSVYFYEEDSFPIVGDSIFDGLIVKLKGNQTYRVFDNKGEELNEKMSNRLCNSFANKTYRFDVFKSSSATSLPILVWPEQANRNRVLAVARASNLMRDVTDTPALSLGPADLALVAIEIAEEFKANTITKIEGVEQLMKRNFPQVAAVGLAAENSRQPILVDIKFNPPNCVVDLESIPEVVIIGKGVCFDTGGLNIKGSSGMRGMKKDKAGAAQAIALAVLCLSVFTPFPYRLRLLLPCVENSIGSNALRPGDIIRARNGKTTEISNTVSYFNSFNIYF